jgi:hypothetical protein
MSRAVRLRLREWIEACRYFGWRNAWCGFCHIRPAMWDDCGFWFLSSGVYTKPCCRHCFEGAPGDAHRARYGVGER